MATRNNLPETIRDPVISHGDTGEAVKIIQQFLWKLSYVRKDLELLESVSHKSTNLIKAPVYGNYEANTRLYVSEYQKKNKREIMNAGEFDEQDFARILGIVDPATWFVMSKSIDKQVPAVKEAREQKEEKQIAKKKITKEAIQKEKKLKDPPSIQKGATHFVKTQRPTSRLALRNAPSYVRVSKDAFEDVSKKGKNLIMMPNNTQLKIIDPHLGYKCEWHQVEVIDTNPLFAEIKKLQEKQNVYCYAEFVQPLSHTKPLLAVRCDDCSPSVKTKEPFPNWTDFDDCEPFKHKCNYYIAVATTYTTSDESVFESQRQDAITQGIEKLLLYYNKERSPEALDRYTEAFNFADSEDWYLDERPGSKMKFLVFIPAKYFDAIPVETEEFDGIPISENDLPDEWRTTHFLTSALKRDLAIVTKKFEAYAHEVDKWNGDLPDFDFREEARKIREFPSVLIRFIKENGFEFRENEEDTLEIGFAGPCFKVIYVLLNTGTSAQPLRIGFDCFTKKSPINSERTMGYIFYLSEIANDFKKNPDRNWISFVQNYTCPIPQIRPSGASNTASKRKVVISEGPEKTAEEKNAEDVVLRNPRFKDDAYRQRRTEEDFIGDNLLSCKNIPGMLNRLETMEDIYDEVLNKIDLAKVAGLVVSCVGSRLPASDIQKVACSTIFRGFDARRLDDLVDTFNDEASLEVRTTMVEKLRDGSISSTDTREEVFRVTIEEVITPEELCEYIFSFDPEAIKELIRRLSPQDPSLLLADVKTTIPTISLPDDLHTEDILASIAVSIERAIIDTLTSVLISTVKSVFGSICDSVCSDVEENYGDTNLNDSFDEVPDTFLDDFGILKEDIPEAFFEDFFNALSDILLPSELCSLLEGTAIDNTLKIVKELVDSSFPKVAIGLSNKEKIRSLFVKLGEFVDPQICKDIRARLREVPKELCDDEIKQVRNSLLENRLDSEQLKEQLEKIRAKNRERLAVIAGLLHDRNPIEGIIPPIIHDVCQKRNINLTNIIPQPPPSVDLLVDKTIGIMFDSVGMSFNSNLRDFVTALIEGSVSRAERATGKNRKEMFKSQNALRKQLSGDSPELSPSDTEILLRDPDGTGENRGRRTGIVAPELLENLKRRDNFRYKYDSYDEQKSEYTYSIHLESIISKLNNIREQSFLGKPELENLYSGLVAKLNDPKTDREAFVESGIADFLTKQAAAIKKGAKPDTEPPSILQYLRDKERDCDIEKKIDEAETLRELTETLSKSDFNVITYEQSKSYTTKGDLKDDYKIIIIEPETDFRMSINHSGELSQDIKAMINNPMFSVFKSDASPQQQIFAEFVANRWRGVVEQKSAENVKRGTDFFKFFETTAYHNVLESFMELVSSQVSNSPYFKMQNLEELDLFTNIYGDESGLCPPDTSASDSLLNFEGLKSQVKIAYEKGISVCPARPVEEKVPEKLEKAALGAAVNAMIRVFAIDYFLRGLFVFSEFKMDAMMGDGSIVKYLVEKTKKEMKKRGEGFYKRFALEAKDYLDERDAILNDPYTGEVIVFDELHPDTQSGEHAIEFLLKENIKDLSSKFEKLFGKTTKDFDFRMVKDWICKPKSNTNDPTIFGVGENVKEYFLGDTLCESGLVFETYVRTCKDREFVTAGLGRDRQVRTFKRPSEEEVRGIGNEIKNDDLTYGIRILYVPPASSGRSRSGTDFFREFNFRDTKFPEQEKAWRMMGDRKIGKVSTYSSLAPPMYHPFPLLQVEDNVLQEGRLSTEEEKKLLDELIRKMIDSDEYKLLFRYCFPLQRLVVFSSLYSMVATSATIENLDVVFEETKRSLEQLQNILSVPEDGAEWWNRKDPNIEGKGGNLGIREERMNNITTQGPHPSLAQIAANTLPLLIKGFAEKLDPSYKLIKSLHVASKARIGLNWGSVPLVMPINIFGILGFGPPLGPWGAVALSTSLLSGERRKVRDWSYESVDEDEQICSEEEKTNKENS